MTWLDFCRSKVKVKFTAGLSLWWWKHLQVSLVRFSSVRFSWYWMAFICRFVAQRHYLWSVCLTSRFCGPVLACTEISEPSRRPCTRRQQVISCHWPGRRAYLFLWTLCYKQGGSFTAECYRWCRYCLHLLLSGAQCLITELVIVFMLSPPNTVKVLCS